MAVKPKQVDCGDLPDRFSDGNELTINLDMPKGTTAGDLIKTGTFGKSEMLSSNGKDYLCIEIGKPKIGKEYYNDYASTSVLYSFDPSLISSKEAEKEVRQGLSDDLCDENDMYGNIKVENEDLCDID
jgi:hypothetical protein